MGVGTPSSFWPEALPWAQEAHAATGVLVSVILGQWAIETEYGGADWSPNNNPGNVGSFDGEPVASFRTLAEGVAAYVQTMNAPDRPEFGATIRKASTYEEQAYLLGAANPVWASARYALPGGAPGSEIVSIIQSDDLTRYDADAPAPVPYPTPPSPSPTPVPVQEAQNMQCTDPITGGVWTLGSDGHVEGEPETAGGPPYLGGLNGNRFSWEQIGTLAGFSARLDGNGQWGYDIAVARSAPDASGSWFSHYTFPRNASLATVLEDPAADATSYERLTGLKLGVA